ncbi:Multidrug resistance protein MdtG [Candidatus Lokiarchaeum ossiferum]|uniref:Multidrug resistance protein MdtG n=1 Tax=Candidatus Lokiarchaeum ossiferum TaxID=2951803 RepID=A0ABY6HQE4_9ARCH|nr:Multidrug resistance protein MdtG [Candidatus Lokiarchaeum sp. B-35]
MKKIDQFSQNQGIFDRIRSNISKIPLSPSLMNQKWALFTLSLCLFVDTAGYSMVLPLLPSFATHLGASPFTIGLIISMNAVTTMIFSPLWGKWSDKSGRIKPLLLSQVGTVISFALLAVSTNISMLFISRILDGIFGGQAPIVKALFADVTTPEERRQKMGQLFFGVSLGIIVGPALGGFLGSINWMVPCLLAALLGACSIILTFKFLPDTRPFREKTLSPSYAGHLSHPENNKYPEKSKLSIQTFLILLQIFLVNLAFSTINSSLPIYLDLRFSVGAEEIGFLYLLVGIEMLVFTGVIFKPLLRKIGEKKVFLFANLGMVLLFFLFPFLNQFWIMFVFMGIQIIFLLSIKPIIALNLAKKFPPAKQGTLNGWGVNAQYLAKILAPLITTFYLEIEYIGVLHSYFLIGWTSVVFCILLLLTHVFDSRS